MLRTPRPPLIHRSPMPGLGLTMGITITMLSLVVLLPIGALLAKGASFGLGNVILKPDNRA